MRRNLPPLKASAKITTHTRRLDREAFPVRVSNIAFAAAFELSLEYFLRRE